MGLIYSSSDSQNMMSGLSQVISKVKNLIQQEERGIQKLTSTVGTDGMSGKAYTAGGEFFSEYILKYVHKLNSATNDINNELKKYQAADAEVSSYGYLNEDELNATKASFQSTIRSLSKIRDNYQRRGRNEDNQDTTAQYRQYAKKFQWQIEGQQEGLKETEKELAKLRQFNSKVSGLFNDSFDELKSATTALNSIASSNFGKSGLSLSKHLNTSLDEFDTGSEFSTIENYKKAYDMDYNLSKEVFDFSKTFNRYAKKQGWSKKYASYMFAMYIASLSTAYSSTKWRFAAGTMYPDDAKNHLKKMGYSEKFLTKFSDALYDNHFKNKNPTNDFVHIMGSLSVILHPYKKSQKIDASNLSLDNFNSIRHITVSSIYNNWDKFSNFTMKMGTSPRTTTGLISYGKAYFATAEIGSIPKGDIVEIYNLYNVPKEIKNGNNQFVSAAIGNDDNVKADATYRGDIASGPKGVSISDTRADTDGLNLSTRVQHGEKLTSSLNSYSEWLNSGGNRTTELYRNLGNGKIDEGKKEFRRQVFREVSDPGSLVIKLLDQRNFGSSVKASNAYWECNKIIEETY